MAIRIYCALAILGSLTGCDEGILAPAGPISGAERIILLDSLAIMLTIVIPVIIAVLAFAWWFRASNKRARHLPEWSYSGRLELLVWSIPALVVLFLGGIAWISSHDLDPARPLESSAKPVEVEVVSLDWRWLFIYPQQKIASINKLVVPAGVPLHLRLTSATVMNVFFVPRLGSEIYTMNGMATQLNLEASQPGIYQGLSAHFSGDGFSDMAFTFDAVSADQFAAWVAAAQKNGTALDDATYHGLMKQSRDAQSFTYRNVQPGLFDAIVQQKLPPGKGPQTGDKAHE